ncbi:MAG TPA: metallophosphoesterase, partial [Anaerolineales bacterium]|nr:metallophosphoesterase [Anaerolineales bacterium]
MRSNDKFFSTFFSMRWTRIFERYQLIVLFLLLSILVAGCDLSQGLGSDSVVFAAIGDYGSGSQFEEDVADLVKGWRPDLIITTGDNNYPDGSAETIDTNIGQYYHAYIYPYTGGYGKGADQNRFFPTLGNHDWKTAGAEPHLDYFTLPGNERYYDFTWGPVHFFALDSDPHEPDGVKIDSYQADWLRERMAASSEPWKIVFTHFPPQASSIRGSADWMRWPFDEWGATAVLAGHEHVYERLVRKDVVYFVNGLGGDTIYEFDTKLRGGSIVRYNED